MNAARLDHRLIDLRRVDLGFGITYKLHAEGSGRALSDRSAHGEPRGRDIRLEGEVARWLVRQGTAGERRPMLSGDRLDGVTLYAIRATTGVSGVDAPAPKKTSVSLRVE